MTSNGAGYALVWNQVRESKAIIDYVYTQQVTFALLDSCGVAAAARMPIGKAVLQSVRPILRAEDTPFVAFSGSEYAVVYAEADTSKTPVVKYNHFVRVDLAGAVVAGSDFVLPGLVDTKGITDVMDIGVRGLLWNPVKKEWAVVWADASGDTGFTRVDATGKLVAGSTKTIARAPTTVAQLLWNGARYAVMGSTVTRIELTELSDVGVPLSTWLHTAVFPRSVRFAWNGSGYGVAWNEGTAGYFGRFGTTGWIDCSQTPLTTLHPGDLVWGDGRYRLAEYRYVMEGGFWIWQLASLELAPNGLEIPGSFHTKLGGQWQVPIELVGNGAQWAVIYGDEIDSLYTYLLP